MFEDGLSARNQHFTGEASSAGLPFIKAESGGNPTLLIDNRDGRIDRAEYAQVGRLLMREPFVGGEQVGFVEQPLHQDRTGRLAMMGGELCLNALRAYAVVLGREAQQAENKFVVESSGVPDPFDVAVQGSVLQARVTLSMPLRPRTRRLTRNNWRVDLPGITHFVELTDEAVSEAELQERLNQLSADEPCCGIPALGMIACRRDGPELRITPLVRVIASDTSIMETSCGSGSVAAALVCSKDGAARRAWRVWQPSGHYIDVDLSGTSMKISGESRLLATGMLYL